MVLKDGTKDDNSTLKHIDKAIKYLTGGEITFNHKPLPTEEDEFKQNNLVDDDPKTEDGVNNESPPKNEDGINHEDLSKKENDDNDKSLQRKEDAEGNLNQCHT